MVLTHHHWYSFLLTIAALLLLGMYSARRVKSAEAFSLGGRVSGAAIVSGTIAGTIIGGAATVGTAQLAYSTGLSAWWFTLGSGIGFLIMGLCYTRPLRQTGLETIPQYLILNYGPMAGPLTSIIASLGIFFSIVANSLSGIHLISTIFNLTSWQAGMMIIVLVAASVFFGGMQGAGLSGMLKVGIIYVTLCAAGFTAFSSLKEMPDFTMIFPSHPWFSLFGRGGWVGCGNLLSLIVGVICTQTYVQAIYAARDARTAAVGTFAAALVTIPVGLPSVAIGMFMHAAYPGMPPIDALPVYMMQHMPAWLGGIGLAGLLLSVIGAIAGLALGIGTMVSRDIFHGLLGIEYQRLLWINRITILLVTCCAIVMAIGNLQSLVLEWNYLSMALRGAGIFLPLTTAVFWPGKLTPAWAIGSMGLSTLAAVICPYVLPMYINPLFVGLAVSALVVVLGITVVSGLHSFASKIR